MAASSEDPWLTFPGQLETGPGQDYAERWYRDSPMIEMLPETVAMFVHDSKPELSDTWGFGNELERHDIDLILSNAQAHYHSKHGDVTFSRPVDIASWAVDGLTSSDGRGSWLQKLVLETRESLFIPVYDRAHYCALYIDAVERHAHWFDSLNIRNEVAEKVACACACLGLKFSNMKIGWQRDEWSCGLWSIFVYVGVLHCRSKCLTSGLSFDSWFYTEYVTKLRQCSDEDYLQILRCLHSRIGALYREGDYVGNIWSTVGLLVSLSAPVQYLSQNSNQSLKSASCDEEDSETCVSTEAFRQDNEQADMRKEVRSYRSILMSNRTCGSQQSCEVKVKTLKAKPILEKEDCRKRKYCAARRCTGKRDERRTISCKVKVECENSVPLTKKAMQDCRASNSIPDDIADTNYYAPLEEICATEREASALEASSNSQLKKRPVKKVNKLDAVMGAFDEIHNSCDTVLLSFPEMYSSIMHLSTVDHFSESQIRNAYKRWKERLKNREAGLLATTELNNEQELISVPAANGCMQADKTVKTSKGFAEVMQIFDETESAHAVSSFSDVYEIIKHQPAISGFTRLQISNAYQRWKRRYQGQAPQVVVDVNKRNGLKRGNLAADVMATLVAAGFDKRDKSATKLATLFLTEHSDLTVKYDFNALYGAVRRFFNGSLKKGPYPICNHDWSEELPNLESDMRIVPGIELDKQMYFAISYHQQTFMNTRLPMILDHIRNYCNQSKTKERRRWTPQLNLRLSQKLSSFTLAELDVDVFVKGLKEDEKEFSQFTEDLIRAKVLALKATKDHVQNAGDGQGGSDVRVEWNAAIEIRYRKALRHSKIDFSKHSIRSAAEVITGELNNKVRLLDVTRRLIEERAKALKKSGVDMRTFAGNDESCRYEEDTPEDIAIMEKLAIADAAKTFAKLKIEGPTSRCACCGQLNFASSMVKLSNKKLQDLFALREVQIKLAYLKSLPAKDPRRLTCGGCNDAFQEGRTPTFCFGEDLPHNEIPKVVSDLSDLEADLVSSEIAFARIEQVQWQKQKRLKGAVVNVPADYLATVKQLPRSDMHDFKQAVDLKRKLEYKGYYKRGLVRVQEVRRACQLLCKSPLYVEADVNFVNTLDEYVVPQDPVLHVNADKDDTEEKVDHEICDLAQSHKDKYGNTIVADDEDLYEDEDEIIAEGHPSCTMLDSENNANELRESVLRVAPSEGKHPQGILCSPHGEELCFPRLFGGHSREGYGDTHYSMIARHELRSADRRFACDPSNIFFKMRKIHCQTVCGSANMAIRRAKMGTVTAGQLKSPIERDQICEHDLGYFALTKLRTSPDYKAKIKKDMFAMIQQIGKPCWFVTMTCGTWPELLQVLHKVKHGTVMSEEALAKLSSAEKAQMIAGDPVTCARYYERRVSKYIRTVFMNSTMIGKVIDYAGVEEFTVMGNPHTHLVIWNQDAPTFEQDPDEQVIDYIDKYVTTDLDDIDPVLGNVQRHKHKRRCGGRFRPCSFGFPKPPMESTTILKPFKDEEINDRELEQCRADFATLKNALREVNVAMKEAHIAGVACPRADASYSSFLLCLGFTEERYLRALQAGIERPTVFHKRKLKHLMVNAFNRDFLTTWEANVDIQHILNPWAATMYVASYISKSQRGLSSLMRAVSSGIFSNGADLVRRTGRAWIQTSEISVQEAVYHVLGLNFRRFSREVFFINTGLEEETHRMSKRKSDLMELDDDDTDCFMKTHMEKYSARKHLLDFCMADYFAKVRWVKKKDNEGNESWQPEMRERPKVLRWIGVRKEKNLEMYCREQILLFLPWQNDFDAILEIDDEEHSPEREEELTWSNVYAANEAEIRCNRKAYRCMSDDDWDAVLAEVEKAAANINGKDPCMEGDTFGDKPNLGHDDDENCPVEPIRKATLLSRQDLSNFKTDDEFAKLIASFNLKQHLFFDYVMYRIHDYESEPLHVFLTGGAGVGKTHVIHAITQAVTKHFNYDMNCDSQALRVLLLAPTGKAGFNINGSTMHAGLSIPPSNVTTQFTELRGNQLAEAQAKYATLKLVIVDEVSMVGSFMFAKMEARLRQIMKSNRPFGGVHVILVGDLYQLKPVGEPWIFEVKSALEVNLWQKFFKLYELTEIMRQKEDKSFAELLNRLRVGESTKEDRALLKTRELPKNMTVPYIYPENAPKDTHNKLVLEDAEGQVLTLKAIDELPPEIKTARSLAAARNEVDDLPPHLTGGLPSCLSLKPNFPVEVTNNVDVNDGICNGSDGLFMAHKAEKLWIKFYMKRVGLKKRSEPLTRHLQKLHNLQNDWTPIDRNSKDITKCGKKTMVRKTLVTRKQFPVVLAAARTIHHSQGCTYQEGGIDMGSSFTQGQRPPYIVAGMHYVALARYTCLNKVWLTDFDLSKAKVCPKAHAEMVRMREQAYLDIDVPQLCNRNGSLSLYAQNVRSFNKYKDYLSKRPYFHEAEVCFLQETLCSVGGDEIVHEMQCIELQGKTSNPRGIAFLANDSVKLSEIGRYATTTRLPLEALAVQAKSRSQNLCLLGIYKSPKMQDSDFMQEMRLFVESLPIKPDAILGDFNIDLDRETSSSRHLRTGMMAMGYTNVATPFTRCAGPVKSRLDHVWVHKCKAMVKVGYDWFSDHMPVFSNFAAINSGTITDWGRKATSVLQSEATHKSDSIHSHAAGENCNNIVSRNPSLAVLQSGAILNHKASTNSVHSDYRTCL